jgi:hypothetical protein
VEGLGVEPDLALVDDAVDVLVEDLDRILDRHDVLPARAVDVVDHRCERGRLARARAAGDEDEAAVLVGEAADAGRQAERVEGRNLRREQAKSEGHGAALPEPVDAEPGQPGRLVRDVELTVCEERLEPVRCGLGHAPEHGVEVAVRQRGAAVERQQVAVAPEHRRPAELEVHVARPEVDRVREVVVEIHDINRVGIAAPLL